MTKADFNLVDDKFMYLRGKPWETTQKVLGKLWFNIPYAGKLAVGGYDIALYRGMVSILLVAFALIGFRVA